MHPVRRPAQRPSVKAFGAWRGPLCALALACAGADLAKAACPTNSPGNHAAVAQQSGAALARGTIDQSGGASGNVACIDQDGSSPLATIVQIGSTGSVTVEQSGGPDQSAYVLQGGSAGTVTITQRQADGLISSSPSLMQGLADFTSLLAGALNFADVASHSAVVLQSSGAGNEATVLQDVGNNAAYAEIGQLGSGNQADITQGLTQQGLEPNLASIMQQGNRNEASLAQSGAGLNGAISQTGDSNSASLSQTGISLPDVAIAQSGGFTYVTVGGDVLSIPGTSVTVTQTSGGVSSYP